MRPIKHRTTTAINPNPINPHVIEPVTVTLNVRPTDVAYVSELDLNNKE